MVSTRNNKYKGFSGPVYAEVEGSSDARDAPGDALHDLTRHRVIPSAIHTFVPVLMKHVELMTTMFSRRLWFYDCSTRDIRTTTEN